MCPGRTQNKSGGEGGIRTKAWPKASASYRFQIAQDAKIAADAVDHCTPLHAGPRSLNPSPAVRVASWGLDHLVK